MTPEQQAALESLAGRSLTQEEHDQLEVFIDVENRNNTAIAEILSVGRTIAVPTEVGNGTILEVLGFSIGNTLLDAIKTIPEFRHVVPLVEQGRLRLDSPATINALQSLVPAILTQEQANAMKARAYKADPISPAAVSTVLTQLEN